MWRKACVYSLLLCKPRIIFVDLGISPSGPTMPFVDDNKAAINMPVGKERVAKPQAPLSLSPRTSRRWLYSADVGSGAKHFVATA
jgi:hypothetical protein